MYELFILGELSDMPMHGYLLHSILTQVVGPLRPVSWGSLYPILKRLEDERSIEQLSTETPHAGRPKKVYGITPLGRERFLKLMDKPLEHNVDAEDIFRIKLSKFHLIESSLQQEILLQQKSFVELILGGMELAEQRVRHEPCISDGERPYIFKAIEYESRSYEARLAWIEQQIAGRAQGGMSL